jgi:hypothetical protein
VFIHRADNHESPNRCHSLKGYGANIYKELSNLKKPNGINIYSNHIIYPKGAARLGLPLRTMSYSGELFMETFQIQVTNELAQQLRLYRNELPHLLELGLRLIKTEKKAQPISSSVARNNLWNWLDKPVTGKRTREKIDIFLNAERDNWE